jgi:hypothetical protein
MHARRNIPAGEIFSLGRSLRTNRRPLFRSEDRKSLTTADVTSKRAVRKNRPNDAVAISV